MLEDCPTCKGFFALLKSRGSWEHSPRAVIGGREVDLPEQGPSKAIVEEAKRHADESLRAVQRAQSALRAQQRELRVWEELCRALNAALRSVQRTESALGAGQPGLETFKQSCRALNTSRKEAQARRTSVGSQVGEAHRVLFAKTMHSSGAGSWRVLFDGARKRNLERLEEAERLYAELTSAGNDVCCGDSVPRQSDYEPLPVGLGTESLSVLREAIRRERIPELEEEQFIDISSERLGKPRPRRS
jgi:hypothetical protein